ncbi:hypothetical protein VIGAN_04188600, partial [Vigna angularis var. angularis]
VFSCILPLLPCIFLFSFYYSNYVLIRTTEIFFTAFTHSTVKIKYPPLTSLSHVLKSYTLSLLSSRAIFFPHFTCCRTQTSSRWQLWWYRGECLQRWFFLS